MPALFGMFPFLKKLFADSGYQGPKFANALIAAEGFQKTRRISIEKRSRSCGFNPAHAQIPPEASGRTLEEFRKLST
jgi:hypothetical protein